MANKVEFAERLVEYRGRREWSQSELAEIMGVHRNTIASWESGTIPSRGVVFRLADELSLSNAERNSFLKVGGFDKQWPAKYWNVPYKRNPYFVGRETELQSLRQRLVPGTKTTAFVQSISGLGGVGKTQTAVEYAHRYGEYYEAVLWILADSPEVATAAWLQLATQELGLPEQQEAEQQITEVKRWLRKRHGWLLIFDNVEDPQEILSTFVPNKHQGNVLITTRRRDAGEFTQNEILPLLTEDAAVLFLLRRARYITRETNITETDADDIAHAKNLCQLLDRLPLALDQAAAYIAENGSSFQRYIDLYRQYRRKLLARRNASTQETPLNVGDHPNSVLTTFSLSWQQIQKQNALADRALQFCAFLAPDQIPEPLVAKWITPPEPDSPRNALEIDEALGLLHRYSLIERVEGMLSLHRLVQEMLPEADRCQGMEQVVAAVESVFPLGDHKTWTLCEFFLPHSLVCSKWIPHLKQNRVAGGRLLGSTGYYLYERAQYGEAETLLQRALEITEEQFGPSHPITAGIVNYLAILYVRQSRYEEAEPLLQRALGITEGQSDYYLATATQLNNLGLLYREKGHYEEAEPLLQHALDIAEQQLGPSHPNTATQLNSLASLYLNQHRYEEAEPLLQRALGITEQQLGPSHPNLAVHLNNLAFIYVHQHRYEKAESLLQHALDITEQQLGPSHPDLAVQLNNLAHIYNDQGRYEEAEPLLQRALRITEEQLGPSHPDLALRLNNLAVLYRDQGHHEAAEPLLRRALLIREAKLGPSHPDTLSSLDMLAQLYNDQHRYEEAEPLWQRVLRITEEQFGSSHPSIAAHLNSLAVLYISQRRYEEAEPLLQRALLIEEEQLGPSHPDTLNSLHMLAIINDKLLRRYGKAELLYERVAMLSQKFLGTDHPKTQEFTRDYLAFLASRYTDGDIDAMLRLLKLREGKRHL